MSSSEPPRRPIDTPPAPVRIIWWRYGKEHGENDGFRVNPPEVIDAALDRRLAEAERTETSHWRWYQVSEDLLVARGDPAKPWCDRTTRMYYLLDRGLGVVENIRLDDGRYSWYIHLAKFLRDDRRQCWIMKDLFVDVLVRKDLTGHRVVDLDDLAEALDLGLIDSAGAADVLRRTERLSAEIDAGRFPPPRVIRAQEACKLLGW